MTLSNQQLNELEGRLIELDPEKEEEFQQLIQVGLEMFEDQKSMAAFFSVTPPTVSRWKQGKARPLGPMRQLLKTMLLKQLQELQSQPHRRQA